MTASLSHLVPTPKSVKDLFEELLGRPVTVSEASPVVAEDVPATAIAIYVDNSQRLSAVIGLDLRLAAYAGAAVGLMPVGSAEVCLEDKALTPVITENLQEIFNILSSLLNREGAPRLHLGQAYAPGDSVPNDVVSRLLAIGQRIDLMLNVSGYGGGRLTVSVVG